MAAEEGFALRQTMETDEGVFVEGAAVTEDEAVYAAAVETDEGAAAVIATATAEDASGEEESAE